MMRQMKCRKLDMADHNSSPIGTNYGHDCQSRAANHGPKQIPEQEKHSINRNMTLHKSDIQWQIAKSAKTNNYNDKTLYGTSCDKFLLKHKAAFSPNHNLNIKRQTPDTLLSDKVVLNTDPAGTGTLTKYTLIKYLLKLV